MVRVLLILVVLVLVPAVILFWRTRERGGVSGGPQKSVGTSTLSHGGPPSPSLPVAPPTSEFIQEESRRRQP